jgi:hypothetical protein
MCTPLLHGAFRARLALSIRAPDWIPCAARPLGYRARMSTTPSEPSPDPEVVPSGDPSPISTPEPEPREDPGVPPTEPEIQPPADPS